LAHVRTDHLFGIRALTGTAHLVRGAGVSVCACASHRRVHAAAFRAIAGVRRALVVIVAHYGFAWLADAVKAEVVRRTAVFVIATIVVIRIAARGAFSVVRIADVVRADIVVAAIDRLTGAVPADANIIARAEAAVVALHVLVDVLVLAAFGLVAAVGRAEVVVVAVARFAVRALARLARLVQGARVAVVALGVVGLCRIDARLAADAGRALFELTFGRVVTRGRATDAVYAVAVFARRVVGARRAVRSIAIAVAITVSVAVSIPVAVAVSIPVAISIAIAVSITVALAAAVVVGVGVLRWARVVAAASHETEHEEEDAQRFDHSDALTPE
jgi:hypothetical protein